MYDVMDHVRFEERRFLDQYNIYYFYYAMPISKLKSILINGIFPYDKKVNDKHGIVDPINKLTIDSYIPFYFNLNSALLYTQFQENMNNNMIILAIDRDFIFYKNTIYTDGDPLSDDTNFYDNYMDLNNLDWDNINNSSKKRNKTEKATILIPNKVWSNNIL